MTPLDLLLSFLIFCLPLHIISSATDPRDVSVLRSLSDQLQNTPPGWDMSDDPCGAPWEGVTCNNSRVTALRLSTMGLRGKLSGDIGSLSELTSLDLSFNKGLTGSLSPRLGDLQKLNILILAGCGFSGEIPSELGNLSELSFLALNSNNFTGGIPPSLGSLSKLYWLDLADNQLTGSIPISTSTKPGLDLLLHAKHLFIPESTKPALSKNLLVMWIEIFCGLVIFRLFRGWFYDDDVMDMSTSDAEALFSVAKRVESLYGGKVYVGLRVPDADTGSQQDVDVVVVTQGEAVVISVKNLSGLVSIDADGKWVCTGNSSHKTEHLPNPVAEAKTLQSVVESYLQQRGVVLPENFLSFKILLPNPKCSTIYSDSFPAEVVTYDQWKELKPERKHMFSGWMKGALRGGKKEMQDSLHQKLNFVLRTAPMWDRLDLKGDKCILGEFLEFKGKQEDLMSLKNIRRSKVSRLIIQKFSMFGLAHSKVQLLYCARDYRSEGASASEWIEVTVRSSTEVLFRLKSSEKIGKFKLSQVASLFLSA